MFTNIPKLANPAPPAFGPLPNSVDQIAGSLPSLSVKLLDPESNTLDVMETAVFEAESIPARVAADLVARARAATRAEVKTFMQQLVSAWPNTLNADLAGYTAQLVDELGRERPTWHALKEGMHRLRRSSRFLPSISEVMDSLTTIDKQVRNCLWHLDQMPAALERTKQYIQRERETRQRGRERQQRYSDLHGLSGVGQEPLP